MRGFAILALVIAVSSSSLAEAAPMERPKSRFPAYDQASAPQLRRGGTTAPAASRAEVEYPESRYREPQNRRSQSVRRAQYQQPRRRDVEPSHYQEDIPPGAMTDGPAMGEFYEGQSWDDGYVDGYGGECCDDCCYGPVPGFWGRAEYLYWWVRGANTPALVTTSPTGTDRTVAGILPNATVLFGNQRVNTSGRSGARFTLGYWFEGCDYTGIETSYFFLGDVNQQYYNGGPGIVARPFFNTNSGAQDALLINYPSFVSGWIKVNAESKVYGGDVNLRRALVVDRWKQISVLAGYRYFGLSEGLGITSFTNALDQQGSVESGTTFNTVDSFTTRNTFNGGQIGVNAQMTNGAWTLDLLGKLALGANSQTVRINGSTLRTNPDSSTVNSQGGILALPSNIGNYHRNQFAVLPEFGANLRYQLTPLWRLNVGYTLLIVTNVVRPGDQIDLNVDPQQFPIGISGSQPRFSYVDSDLWLQGINFGIECNF